MFIKAVRIKKLADELLKLAFEKRRDQARIVIYGADLTAPELKEFRQLKIQITSADLTEASRRFGKKQKNENVHISRGGSISPVPVNFFHYRDVGDAYAAFLFAASGGRLSGVSKGKDGFFGVLDQYLKTSLAEHLANLIVARAA